MTRFLRWFWFPVWMAVAALFWFNGCHQPPKEVPVSAEFDATLILVYNGQSWCGAVRTGQYQVYTAAHCVHENRVRFIDAKLRSFWARTIYLDEARDVAELAIVNPPEGPWARVEAFNDERGPVRIESWHPAPFSSVVAHAVPDPTFPVALKQGRILIATQCYGGQSGSPIYRRGFVVGVVVQRAPGLCYGVSIIPSGAPSQAVGLSKRAE